MFQLIARQVRGGTLSALLASAALMIPALPAVAGQTDSYTLPQQSYNQSRARNYKVYVPSNVQSPAPMVMALHGCKQTNNDVLNDWGLKAAADEYGFILVAPFITSYDGLRNENCWGFWFDHHRHEGAGEVEDLHQIAQAVESNYTIDANRRYITGLSSGGAMATVASVAHNEYWAAAAPASGLPYGEDSASVSLSGQCPGSATFHSVSRVSSDMQSEVDDQYPIPLMVLQNENDCTVLKEAADNTRDAHLQVFGESGSRPRARPTPRQSPVHPIIRTTTAASTSVIPRMAPTERVRWLKPSTWTAPCRPPIPRIPIMVTTGLAESMVIMANGP